MRIRWMVILAAASLVVPAMAQVGRGGGGGPGGGPGGERGMRGRGRGGPPMQRLAERLALELELNDEQMAELDEIVADFRERFQQMGGPSEEDRQLWQEMREARQSGDRQRMQELREQFRQRRGEPMREMMDSFFTEVETILDDEQLGRLATMRERMAQMGRGNRPGQRDPRRMLESLPEQLELTAEQQAKFDELADEFRAKARERWSQRAEEMRPLWEEMRAAHENGDRERIEQLRRQMMEARGGLGQGMTDFFDQLAEILTEEQQAKLAEIRQNFGPGRGQQAEQVPDLRTILRAIRRLKLDREQRSDVQKIVEEAMKVSREINRRDTQAQNELARKTRQEIAKVLTAEQVKQFDEALASERPNQGRQRGDRAGQGRRTGRGERPRGERPRDGSGNWDEP